MSNYEWEDSPEEVPEETEEPTEPDTAFAEAEERLLTAQYYRVLLGNSFFDDTSATAHKVEKEIRAFVRGRMEVLLGIRAENAAAPVGHPFSDEEVEALKHVAARVLDKPGIAKVPAAKKSQPEPPSSQQLPPAPKGPSLKKASVPASVKDNRGGPKQSAPRKSKNPNVKTATVQQFNKEGEVVGTNTFEYEELPPNPETGAIRIKREGRILERRVHPQTGAELWQNITPQATPNADSAIKPVPQPTGHHLTTLMTQQADAQIARVNSGGGGVLADLISDALSK